MTRKENGRVGEILDAIEVASDQELRVLKDIRAATQKGESMRISRSNGAPKVNKSSTDASLLREVVRQNRKKEARNGVNGAVYMRNKNDLRSKNDSVAHKAAEKIVNSTSTRRNIARDERGRFASPVKVGGNTIVVNPRAPRQPAAKSLYGQNLTKSAQQQNKLHADAQREAVEEQTKETIDRQDKTNNLLEELIKETRKPHKTRSRTEVGTEDNTATGGSFLDTILDWLKQKNKKSRAGKIGTAVEEVEELGEAAASTVGKEAKTAGGAVRDASGRFVKKGAVEAAEDIGKKEAVKLAEKGGLKMLSSAALKIIPGAQVIGAGIDAYNGWADKEGQREAFGLKEGQEASPFQQGEYIASNVLDMGGLITGGANLLGITASTMGMDKTGAVLQSVSTKTIAKGIDDVGTSVVDGISDSWKDFKSVFTGRTEEQEKKDDDRTAAIISALGMVGAGPTPQGQTARDAAFANPVNTAMHTANLTTDTTNMASDINRAKYQPAIEAAAKKYGVDPEDLHAIINTESSYNPNAASGTGPVGLMQISETLAKEMGYSLQDRLNPTKNIEMGAKYYAKNLKTFKGNKRAALLAYNQGTGGARSQMRNGKLKAEGENYINSPKFAGILKDQDALPSSDSDLLKSNTSSQMADVIAAGAPSSLSDYSNMMIGIMTGDDKSAGALLSKYGIGHGGNKPSKGLTLPKGIAMPASLAVHTASLGALADQNGSLIPAEPAQATSSAPAAAKQTPGMVEILRSSAADTFGKATQGISGSGIMDGLLGGLNPFAADVMKPLTGAAGGQLDKWINTGKTSVIDMLNGTPKKPPTVTDLAQNGATETVSRDLGAFNADEKSHSLLQQLVDNLSDLLGVTKDGQKEVQKSGDPSKVRATNQPAPSQNIPLQGAGQAFEEIIRGLF